MSNSTEKTRNLGIDILCCLGVMLLLGLQYIAETGFALAPVQSYTAALPIAARWFCLSGAMLLAACTGYILSEKKFSPSYFKILIRPIYIYIVCSLCAMVIRHLLLHEPMEIKTTIQGMFAFTATENGRILGMYIALLLAAPFINAAFHGLKRRQARQAFLVIAAAVSTLQPMLYIGGIYVLPEWCKGLFPLAAYIGGAYIRRYSKRKEFLSLLIFLISICLAQTVVVLSVSLTKGVMYCPWLDSMASLPSLGVALCLVGLFHSRKEGDSTGHRFFAAGANGALAALLLGDPFLECLMPALAERFPERAAALWAGLAVVPIAFIICCTVGLMLQGPLFLVRHVVSGEEVEDEETDTEADSEQNAEVSEEILPETGSQEEDEEEGYEPCEELPEATILPERAPIQPNPEARETNPRHTISVPVSQPGMAVHLTQPPAEKPIGVHEVNLPERGRNSCTLDDILQEQGVSSKQVPESVDDLIAALMK